MRVIKIGVLLILLIGQSLLADNYFSYRLFILDFENRSTDKNLNWLVKELPDYIFSQSLRLPEVEFLEGSKFEYYDNERDDLAIIPGGSKFSAENISLLGTFFQKPYSDMIEIQLQFVKVSPYENYAVKTFAVAVDRPEMIKEALITAIADVFQIEPLDKSILTEHVKININEKTMSDVTRELASLKDEISSYEKSVDSLDVYSSGIGQAGNVYYRKLNTTDAQADLEISLSNTKTVKTALYDIFSNPYMVEIGEPNYSYYPYNPELVHIRLEISYELKRILINEVLDILPFRKYRAANTDYDYLSYAARFSDIPFQLRRDIQLGNYRVIPVVKFINKENEIKQVMVDGKYIPSINTSFSRIPINFTQQFKQLLVLTSSSVDIQLYLKDNPHYSVYELDMPVRVLENIDRVSVEFIKATHVEKYLRDLNP